MVVDPDSDRLALVSDAGVPLGEEYTLAMVADLLLDKINTDIVVNVSTSRVIEDIAKKNYKKTFRTKVGEINVSTEMLKRGCLIGGEGNGGIILPEIHPGRDALVGAGLILQYLYEGAFKRARRQVSWHQEEPPLVPLKCTVKAPVK